MTKKRVFVVGATGTIGQATVRSLIDRGHDVVCLVRPASGVKGKLKETDVTRLLAGATVRFGNPTDGISLVRDGLQGEHFDAVISCMASRTGAPKDAWSIDYQAHLQLLSAVKAAGVRQFVLLSAICVQKPLLEFQRAKLAFEDKLIQSGLIYSIVRPTAYFKSLSGQINRVKQGKPFLLFGNGELTACKPISDRDLGNYLAGCLDDETRQNQILPIGGPGPAITPLQQGDYLFGLLGISPRYRRVPVGLMDTIISILAGAGRVVPALADKAEFARIGRYYATESMLVLDPVTGRYDAEATPSTGADTLYQHYQDVLSGRLGTELGDHAVF